TARSDHAESVAGTERKGHVLDDRALIAGGDERDPFHRQPAGRSLQLRWGAAHRHLLEQTVETMPALPRGDKTLPVRDREIDRRERPGAQDGACDDDASRRL